ncbi:MAG TPA: M4 family metallopeptidase [Holophagaceae bacterium]|nr:M4 family metallopeptidase [Holophagaceae bacterium]
MPNRPLTASPLILLLAAGFARAQGLPGDGPAASQARSALAARAVDLGLAEGSAFRVRSLTRLKDGSTLARVQQTHQGLPVWGTEGTLRLDAQGRPGLLSAPVVAALQVDTRPGVDVDRLTTLIQRRVAGPLAKSLQPELVVVPASAGPKLRVIQRVENGQVKHQLDMAHSVFSAGPRHPMLAWHVRADWSQGTSTEAEEFMVDAHTGRILDRWPALKSDQPVRGTAHTQYSGPVALDTTDLENGSFRLYDLTRGSVRNPLSGLPGLGVYNLQRFWEWPYGQRLFFESGTNAWGDGQNLDLFSDPWGDTTTVTGQTAGADALYGLETAWDMMRQVFGRYGVDGMDTGVYARVHANRSEATWDPATFSLTLGDMPDLSVPVHYGSWIGQPLTMPEIIGHELGHGLVGATARLEASGEAGGLEESAADIFGTLLKFYIGGAGGTGTSIPDTGGNWTFGLQILDPEVQAFRNRYLDLPSQDGVSPDAWYHGLGAFDPHYAAGVGNRAFYFLSQGAPAVGPLRSPYLPAGFPGIGNDKAAQIWYYALTVYTWPSTDYHGARSIAQHAARDLFGDGSPEEIAVANAFAAVNVGAPWGQAPRPLVLLDSKAHLDNVLSVAVTGVPAKPFEARVSFAANPAVTWSAPDGGLIQPDGTFTAPLRPGSFYRVRATSVQDPLEFAEGLALLVNIDVDDDGTMDATDMAGIALRYGRGSSSGADVYPDGWVDDADVQVFTAGFNSVFGN